MAFVCLAAKKALRAALDIGSGADIDRTGGGDPNSSDSFEVARLLLNDMFFVGVVVVTGAGAGIGGAVCIGCGAFGAFIVLDEKVIFLIREIVQRNRKILRERKYCVVF